MGELDGRGLLVGSVVVVVAVAVDVVYEVACQ